MSTSIKCNDCGATLHDEIQWCPSCGSTNLKKQEIEEILDNNNIKRSNNTVE